jgi:hypothetical protein
LELNCHSSPGTHVPFPSHPNEKLLQPEPEQPVALDFGVESTQTGCPVLHWVLPFLH